MSSILTKARRGFGSFELLWALLLVFLSGAAVRLGGWLLGIEISWGTCLLIGVMAPMVVLMLIGVVLSMRESAEEPTESMRESAEEPARSTIHVSQDASRSSPLGEGATADECVRLLQDKEAKRRLRIFLRHSGSFYFTEEYFSEHPLEKCWIPVAGGAVGFYDSEQTALREATAEIDWLRH